MKNLDQWQGVRTAYDFTARNAFNVNLIADAAAFAGMSKDEAEAAHEAWTVIYGEINSPNVSFAVQTNLALQSYGSMALINLAESQASQIVALAKAIVDYLGTFPLTSELPDVSLSFDVSDSGTLPPAFELSVLFRIDDATSSIVSTFSRGTVQIGDFAAAFVKAFPQLALAVAVGSNGLNSLWAVQRTMLDVTIGGTNNGPFFSAPKPLDNMLYTGMVNLKPLPESLVPDGTNLPSQQLFADVDLDRLNSAFFHAVDDNAGIDTANARETLANLFAARQIDWLFADDANGNPSPYTGSGDQLQIAKAAFEQRMRGALASAYTTNTIVQYNVSWSGLPPAIGDFYALYGTVVSTLAGCTIYSPAVPINSGGTSTLTFLFAIDDVQDREYATLNLAWNVTHLEIASMRLQLVDAYAKPPVIGDANIPLVSREYPTPPAIISQQAAPGSSQPSSGNAVVDAAAWHFTYAYQAQLTAHDRIKTSIMYNTNLSADDGGGAQLQANLFDPLARFSATYPVIAPVLGTNDGSSKWNDAANVFRALVNDVANSSNWDAQLNAAAPAQQNKDAHPINADNLNVLFVENALAAVQVERNLIGFPADQPQWFPKNEYIYKTPIVRGAQPVTLFIDNDSAIDVDELPKPDAGEGCSSLCKNVYAVLYPLAAAHISGTVHKFNVACGYQYPVGSISPIVPVVLARSVMIDSSDPQQLRDFSGTLAAALANWASDNAIPFGSDAQPGAQFVFDVTLYAQLSRPDTPLFRLRNLQLNLSDVTP